MGTNTCLKFLWPSLKVHMYLAFNMVDIYNMVDVFSITETYKSIMEETRFWYTIWLIYSRGELGFSIRNYSSRVKEFECVTVFF